MTDDELVRTKAMMRFGVPAGLLALLAFTGPAAGARGTAGQGSGIQWVELDDAAPAEDVPRIAWSEVGDDTWLFESPTLELGSGAEGRGPVA